MQSDTHDTNILFLGKTIKAWEPQSSVPLSFEDAREINNNLTEYFDFLYYLDKKYNGKEKKI
jgi:hypothetical protein